MQLAEGPGDALRTSVADAGRWLSERGVMGLFEADPFGWYTAAGHNGSARAGTSSSRPVGYDAPARSMMRRASIFDPNRPAAES